MTNCGLGKRDSDSPDIPVTISPRTFSTVNLSAQPLECHLRPNTTSSLIHHSNS